MKNHSCFFILKINLDHLQTPLGRLKARALEIESEARADREIPELKKKGAK
jgi:hypothetical protein